MGLREKINENPQIATGATVGLILIAVIMIVWQLLPSKTVEIKQGKSYFTNDDGKTYFEDDAWKIPPYKDKNGKEAVRAHVYRCGASGKPFVGWLEKYDDVSKAKLDKFFADPANRGKFSPDYSDDATRLLKRPLDPRWSKWTFVIFDRLRMIKCPGSNDFADEIMPPIP